MRPTFLALLTAFLSATTVAEAAEAWTYKGTLGKFPIIVEMTELAADGTRQARYSYLAKGVDIPLHAAASDEEDSFTFAEEAPCTPKTCVSSMSGDGTNQKPAPIAADWSLTFSDEGNHLSGTWKDRKSGKTLPVELDYVETRNVDAEFDSALPLVLDSLLDSERIESFPYDDLKFQRPYKKGPVQEFNGARFRIDEDPRIALGYPAIESLEGASPDAANRWLQDQRIRMSLRDFACAARAYQDFGWDENVMADKSPYRSDQMARLEYLSDRLVGLTESGSFFCGGAHPDNFWNYRLGDVKTGKTVAPESLVKGFTFRDYNDKPMDPADASDENPGQYKPDASLVERVKKERPIDESEAESGCEMDTFIRENLSVAFKGHNLVFVLKDLPTYAAACYTDLYSIPLTEARDYLTAEGQRYFVELDR